MLKELHDMQKGLSSEHHAKNCLRYQLINVYQGIKADVFTSFKPASSFEALYDDIRSSISNYSSMIKNDT